MSEVAPEAISPAAPENPAPATGPAVRTPFRRALRRFIRQPAGITGSLLLLLYVVAAVAAPLIAPHDPLTSYRTAPLHAPSGEFLLGTDPIGRDILSRIIYGARPALVVGISAVVVGAVIGCLSGMAAGYFGGKLAGVVMRFWDGVFAVPAVLVGLVLAGAFGGGLTIIAVAAGIAAAPSLARISYAAVLGDLEKGYTEAARAQGLRSSRIFFLHILPNALSPMVIQLALTMSFAVLMEAAFSFLGVGVQPPTAAWGSMLADSRGYLGQAWWYGVFPGLAITGLVLALNFLADAARDALDPKASDVR